MNAKAMRQSPHIVQKRQASWDGIGLAHFHLRTGEIPEHHNDGHLITLSLSDACKGEIRTASGFRTGPHTRGSVCVIPAGQPFSARVEGEAEQLVLQLEPALIIRAASESRLARTVAVVEKCAPHDPVISGVGMALLAELESDNIGGRLYAESLANVLAVHLLRHYTASGAGVQRFVGGLSAQKLRAVLSFVQENYESDLSLAELAQVAGMSTFHFAREFKRTTGTTPHQYLLKFRVDRAKELLSDSQLPLVEVGFRSGFSHQSHFSRLFRKLTGTTPQSYRLMLQT